MIEMAPSVNATGAKNSNDSYQCTTHANGMVASVGITHGVGSRILS